MRMKIIFRFLFFLIILICFSCPSGIGSRSLNHRFFEIQDRRITIIQDRLKQVMMETEKISNQLNPFLEFLNYIIIALIAGFSALISLFQLFYKKSKPNLGFRIIVLIFGIQCAVLSVLNIFLEKEINSQKELARATNAYETCINEFFDKIDIVLITGSDFQDPRNFNQLVDSYNQFNVKLIAINKTFEDNIYIQSMDRQQPREPY